MFDELNSDISHREILKVCKEPPIGKSGGPDNVYTVGSRYLEFQRTL